MRRGVAGASQHRSCGAQELRAGRTYGLSLLYSGVREVTLYVSRIEGDADDKRALRRLAKTAMAERTNGDANARATLWDNVRRLALLSGCKRGRSPGEAPLHSRRRRSTWPPDVHEPQREAPHQQPPPATNQRSHSRPDGTGDALEPCACRPVPRSPTAPNTQVDLPRRRPLRCLRRLPVRQADRSCARRSGSGASCARALAHTRRTLLHLRTTARPIHEQRSWSPAAPASSPRTSPTPPGPRRRGARDRQLRHGAARQPPRSTRASSSSRARSPTRRSSTAFDELRARGRRPRSGLVQGSRGLGRGRAHNAVGTANVVKAAERAGVGRLRLLPDRALLRAAPAGAADHARPSARPEDRATRSRRPRASTTCG